VFKIITNGGKQDRMLLATDLLKRRLQLIEDARSRDPLIDDPTPTLSDIEKTHILFMNAHFKPYVAIGYEYQKQTAASGNLSLDSDVTFNIQQYGDFISDIVAHATLSAPTFAKASGNDTEKPSGRWCHYPGLRVFSEVKFTVNGNPLDSYTSNAAALYNHLFIPKDKRDSWDRCVGQSKDLDGYLAQVTTDSSEDWSDSTLQSHNIRLNVGNGYQTYKGSGSVDALDMWIPLLLWFNIDPRLAVPSVAIPHGQRFLTMKLATQDKMFYLNPHGNSDGAATYSADITVSTLEIYVNNIFVNPDVHDIYIKRIGFTLIRVHREQSYDLTKAEDNKLLNNMQWPIEYLSVGFRVKSYQSTAADNDKWHTFHYYDTATFDLNGVAMYDYSGALRAPSHASAAKINAVKPRRLVTNMSLEAQSVPLFNNIHSMFFDSYMSYKWGPDKIISPNTPGVLFFNFALYPGNYQPSGHVNVSRAREFYLKYTSNKESDGSTDVISSSRTCQMVVWASAINFLLISDGSAVLRYST
jgi:hypothetical protein